MVVGRVSAVQDGGMLITLECLDNGKARDIHALKINVSEKTRSSPGQGRFPPPLQSNTCEGQLPQLLTAVRI